MKVTVQLNAPVNVEVDVDELTEDKILDALEEDLKDPVDAIAWTPDYGDLKDIVRSGCFNFEQLEGMKEDKFFILDC